MAGAAALQNRLWQFVDLVYRNQGEEHSGWLTDAYLRRVATGAGLDVRRAFAERGSVSVRALVVQAKAAATASGVDSTPTFVVTRPGRPAVAVTGGGGLSGPIDEALKGQ
jgi:protein-disulfide isomerase